MGSFRDVEVKILALMEKGLTNRQIGVALDYKKRTIDSYITDIYKKLNTSNRQKAVEVAKRIGVLR